MNSLWKKGGFVWEICEKGRFMSPRGDWPLGIISSKKWEYSYKWGTVGIYAKTKLPLNHSGHPDPYIPIYKFWKDWQFLKTWKQFNALLLYIWNQGYENCNKLFLKAESDQEHFTEKLNLQLA